MNDEILRLAELIDELVEAKGVAYREQYEARSRDMPVSERLRVHAQVNANAKACADALRDAQSKLADIFAKQNGWRKVNHPFGIGRHASKQRYGIYPHGLAFDHPDYFRKDRNGTAIACHLYNIPDDAEEWALEHGLKMTVSDFPSWYWPKACELVVYTPM